MTFHDSLLHCLYVCTCTCVLPSAFYNWSSSHSSEITIFNFLCFSLLLFQSEQKIDEIIGVAEGGRGGEDQSRCSVTYSCVLNRLLLEITSNDYIKSPAKKPDNSVRKSDNTVRKSDNSGSDDTTSLHFILDPLLRQLGMLDPELFHKTVKSVLDDYLLLLKNSANSSEDSENISEDLKNEVDSEMDIGEITQNSNIINILSDLVDHGSVLITFRSVEGTN